MVNESTSTCLVTKKAKENIGKEERKDRELKIQKLIVRFNELLSFNMISL